MEFTRKNMEFTRIFYGVYPNTLWSLPEKYGKNTQPLICLKLMLSIYKKNKKGHMNKIQNVKRFEEVDQKNKPLVDKRNLPEFASPITNALLKNKLFSIKNVDYDFNLVKKDINVYSRGEYLFSKAAIEYEGTDFAIYDNILIKISTLMPLDMRAFGLLVWLLEKLQRENSNKVEFHINEVFDFLGYQPKNRKSKDKNEVSNRMLALSYILLQVFSKKLSKKIKKAEDFYDHEGIKTSSLFSIFNIEYDSECGVFRVVCSDNLYRIYSKSNWNMIDTNEYKKLNTSTEKAVFKYLTYRDYGYNQKIGMKLDLFYEATGLNEYGKYEAKRKLKQALEKMKVNGFIKSYNIDSQRLVSIDLITSKKRKAFDKKTKEETKKENPKNEFEDEIDFSGSYDFL